MKRWQIILIVVIAIASIAIVGGYRLGVQLLQGRIIEALGNGGQLRELKVNWFTIEMFGVSIDAPRGWPSARTLEAEHVTIVPDLRSLLSDQLRIISVVIERPYLSLLRTPGKLRLVPSLTEDKDNRKHDSTNGRAVMISTLNLRNGVVDLYDATVNRPPLRVRIEQIDAVFRNITAPAIDKTHFNLAGIVKGVRHDGTVKLSGWFGPGGADSSSEVVLREVDMVLLQPYLVKKTEVQVSRGALDLKLDSQVRKKHLDGRGTVVLRNLEFAPSRGFFDTFMGLPRTAVISFLKDNDNAISVDFTLSGNTDNPNFSLNENLSTRIAASMAGTLGVSIVNVAEGIGTLGRRGVEGAGSVVEGIGSAIKGLFGGGK
jgi:hypothetical protein